jgi:hypothetical protein
MLNLGRIGMGIGWCKLKNSRQFSGPNTRTEAEPVRSENSRRIRTNERIGFDEYKIFYHSLILPFLISTFCQLPFKSPWEFSQRVRRKVMCFGFSIYAPTRRSPPMPLPDWFCGTPNHLIPVAQ